MTGRDSEEREISPRELSDAQVIWDYQLMHHTLKRCSAGIGLGSHDLGVAAYSAALYNDGLFPVLVFTGANSPTTAARFPRGEAVHYREHAMDLGVPGSAILVEPNALNTGQNVAFSREVLAAARVPVSSVLVVSKPYEERRSFATFRQLWPDVEVVCASEPVEFSDYVAGIGDAKLVIDMLVGALQRVMLYPAKGFAIPQEVPDEVQAAFERLRAAGFVSRLIRG
ncbi:YdcF family protein [Kitasatospora acidiphila]|uniref:YdcF family protein n=1 Tax=Kitasatospora acidiphila TaxID=2567942 RepID=UPI003C78663F